MADVEEDLVVLVTFLRHGCIRLLDYFEAFCSMSILIN